MMTFRSRTCSATVLVVASLPGAILGVFAGEADVVDATIARASDGTFRFDATLAHADTGWEHYANAFEIVDAEGNILAVRTLVHPHVDEQPFTRSISGVVLEPGLKEVTVRGHDSVHGLGGTEMVLSVPSE